MWDGKKVSCISSMLYPKILCVFMGAYGINRKIMRVKWGLTLSGDGCVIKLAFLYFFPTPLSYAVFFTCMVPGWEGLSYFLSRVLWRGPKRELLRHDKWCGARPITIINCSFRELLHIPREVAKRDVWEFSSREVKNIETHCVWKPLIEVSTNCKEISLLHFSQR